jgi:hypothetical protein
LPNAMGDGWQCCEGHERAHTFHVFNKLTEIAC